MLFLKCDYYIKAWGKKSNDDIDSIYKLYFQNFCLDKTVWLLAMMIQIAFIYWVSVLFQVLW